MGAHRRAIQFVIFENIFKMRRMGWEIGKRNRERESEIRTRERER